MICNHCGTALPRGAIFCGECGRRVGAAAETPAARPQPHEPARPAVDDAPQLEGPPARARGWSLSAEEASDAAARAMTEHPVPGAEPALSPPADQDPAAEHNLREEVESTSPAAHERSAAESALDGVARNPLECTQCGATMGPGDIFCGECGSVSRSVTSAFTRSVPQQMVPKPPPAPEGERVQPSEPVEEPDGAGDEGASEDSEPTVAERRKASPLPTMPVFVQSPPGAPPVPLPPQAISSPPPSLSPPQASPRAGSGSWGSASPPDDVDDVEATRIVRRSAGERFVLQFSTGESVTVYGTGLIGRNPRPEPGEYFDQLVRVLDTGRSVSKTHLEFGQEGGVFWIKDRFSGNGTVLREPDSPPRRCESDKRHRVLRGSRVEIGEQFFVVS